MGLTTYCYIFVACAVNHDIFHIAPKHDYVMSKPFASKIPPCPDTQHTHCLLAQTLSVKFLKATCQAAAFDENNRFPYIRAYMHTLDQRMATLYINVCALGPPAGTTRNFSTLVSMLCQTTRRGENRASGCQRFEKNVVFATAKLLIHSTK